MQTTKRGIAEMYRAIDKLDFSRIKAKLMHRHDGVIALRTIERAEASYRQLRNSLEHVETLMATGKTMPIAIATSQLAMHKYMLLRKISKCGQPAQRALQHKISLLYAAAALEESSCTELSQQHKTAMQKVYTAFHGENQPAKSPFYPIS